MTIVFDVNIWISFAIGKKLIKLRDIIGNNNIQIYYSKELLSEFTITASKPKLSKYIPIERIIEIINVMDKDCKLVEPPKFQVQISRDLKDDYLLEISQHVKADYLVTGDNDLLVLKEFKKTKIVTFRELDHILESE